MSALLSALIKWDGLILIGWLSVMSLDYPLAYYVRSNPRSLVNIGTDMIKKEYLDASLVLSEGKVNHKHWYPYIIHAISLMTFGLQVAYFNVNNHILITAMGKNFLCIINEWFITITDQIIKLFLPYLLLRYCPNSLPVHPHLLVLLDLKRREQS